MLIHQFLANMLPNKTLLNYFLNILNLSSGLEGFWGFGVVVLNVKS